MLLLPTPSQSIILADLMYLLTSMLSYGSKFYGCIRLPALAYLHMYIKILQIRNSFQVNWAVEKLEESNLHLTELPVLDLIYINC